MQILSFRIKNFRSIIDTGWVNLSTDNITALVGQNESGKTAVLSALAVTFSSATLDSDDVRYGAELPVISLKTKFNKDEAGLAGEAVTNSKDRAILLKVFEKADRIIEWRFSSKAIKKDPQKYSTSYWVESPDFTSALQAGETAGDKLLAYVKEATAINANVLVATDSAALASAPVAETSDDDGDNSDSEDQFVSKLYDLAPSIILFQEASGLLPDKVDIDDEFKLITSPGSTAAGNFLTAAQIDLEELMDSDTRGRATILKSANKAITADLLDFWTQTVGKSSTLQLECAINQHPFGHERAGKSYLEFLISDNAGPLYTKQRSRGTRWFISFFLQMRASEKANRNRIFLLDEPGANLHEKAQGDVLKLLEKISTSVGIIYSTHSPHLLDERAFYRVLAVERDSKQPLHPTIVIGAHALGAASSDTLSPILTAMGANLSRQTTIKRHNNVILEELSSHYYIRAFWILKNCSQEANFLPATGTSNVSTFANLFLGWGLDFIVVVDDEPSGRSVYNNLKRDLFLDSQKWAARRMFKIPGCEGVEDVFHADDYKNWVIRKPSIVLGQSNAKWAKANGAAKAMHALGFLQAVEREEIKFGTLHPETQDRISNLVDAIATRLSTYSDPIELN